MAWSSESLAAYETAQLALDKPLLAAQMIPVSPDYAKWSSFNDVQTGDITTWVDRSSTSQPARFAYDGRPGLITTTSGGYSNIMFYSMDFGSLIEFDSVFIIGHNFGSLGLTVGVTIEVSDDNAFTTNLTTVADFGSPSDDSRMASLSLTGGRISSQFVRLGISNGGSGTIIPELGEIILGRRRQLEYKPQRPYDIYALSEESSITKSPNGVISKTVYSRRGRELTGDLWVTDDTYLADLVTFYRQCRGPFVWVENPNSAPSSWHFMMRDGPLSIPETNPGLRSYRLVADEQGPESMYLDVEENG
jgi:hypothetical protein